MFFKVLWKMVLFSISVFALLMVFGFGQEPETTSAWNKVGAPGAKTDFGVFAQMKQSVMTWAYGDEVASMAKQERPKSELGKLRSRTIKSQAIANAAKY